MFNPNMRPTPSSPFNVRVRSEKHTQSALQKENVEQVSRKPAKIFSPYTPKYTGTPTRQPRGMRFDYASDPLGFFPTRTTPPKGPGVEQGASDSPLKPGTSGSPLKRGFQYLCDNFIPSFGTGVACDDDDCATESPSGPSRKPGKEYFAPGAFPGMPTHESDAESSCGSKRDAPRTDARPLSPSPAPPPAPSRTRAPPAPAPVPIWATPPPRCAPPHVPIWATPLPRCAHPRPGSSGPPRRISIPDRLANTKRTSADWDDLEGELWESFGLWVRPDPGQLGEEPKRTLDEEFFARVVRKCEEKVWRIREEERLAKEMQEAREREAAEAKRKERERRFKQRQEQSKRWQERPDENIDQVLDDFQDWFGRFIRANRDQKPRVYEEFPEISWRMGKSSARQRSKQEERCQQAEASSSREKSQQSSGTRFHPYTPPKPSKGKAAASSTPDAPGPGPSRRKASASKPISSSPAPGSSTKRTTASSPDLDMKKFSKDPAKYLEWYDHTWMAINSSSDSSALGFSDIPWTILPFPRSPSEVTATAVCAFLNQRCLFASKTSSSSSPAQPNAANRKRALKRELLNWHPDKFSNRVLLRISDAREREAIKDAADVVQKTLTAYINEPEGAAGQIKGQNR